MTITSSSACTSSVTATPATVSPLGTQNIAIDDAKAVIDRSLAQTPESVHSMGLDTESDSGHEYSSPEDLDDFELLVSDIKTILGPTSGLDSNEIDADQLMDRIRAYKSDSKHWQKYAFFDPNHDYTRNGVDDINKKANLLILVWTPGKGSKIHDHANAHCVVKMLSGTLQETLYETPEDDQHELKIKKVSNYTTDQVSYMSDTIGLHRMCNPGTEPAISLHLYTPPYAHKFGCRVFDEATGESKLVSVSNLYSNEGVKNTCSAGSC